MNPLVESLGPVFIVSFALQQLIELLDPILDKVIKPAQGVDLERRSAGRRPAPDAGAWPARPRPVRDHAHALAGCPLDGSVRYRRDEMAQRFAQDHRLQEAGGAGKGDDGSPASRKGLMKLPEIAPRL